MRQCYGIGVRDGFFSGDPEATGTGLPNNRKSVNTVLGTNELFTIRLG
jgi:hypothetical protein